MERLRYRSTSTIDIQAELRERALLAEVQRVRTDPLPPRRSTLLDILLLGRRRR